MIIPRFTQVALFVIFTAIAADSFLLRYVLRETDDQVQAHLNNVPEDKKLALTTASFQFQATMIARSTNDKVGLLSLALILTLMTASPAKRSES